MKSQKPQAKRRRTLLVVALALIVLVAVSLWIRRAPDETEAPQREAVPVQVVAVKSMTLHETVRGIGTLRAPAEVMVSPEVGGRVRSIEFEEGSFVEAGKVLVELEDEKLRKRLAARQAAVEAAEVRLENARSTFQRQERLMQQGVVTEDEFEAAEAELNSAAADLERFQAEAALVEEELEDTIVRAPFSGMISERLVDRGAYVAAGASLAQLYEMDPLELAFSVPERFLGRVQRGQDVAVSMAAYPDRSFSGHITFVSPAIDEATRTLAVKASVPNPEAQLSPGAFATAVVTIGERENRPVVPDEALVGTRAGYTVFVVENGIAHSRPVETGLRRDGLVEIREGLEVGERVVRSGHMRLEEGDEVREVGSRKSTVDSRQ